MRAGALIAGLCAGVVGATSAHAQRARPAQREEAHEWRPLATFRVMGGGAYIWGASDRATFEWTLDMHAGLRFVDTRRRNRYLALGGDVGLSLGPRGGDVEALGLVGPWAAYGGLWAMAAWSPRFVFGSVAGATALGLRNTFSVCALVGVVCLDASHQYLSVGDGAQHDLRVSLGLDLGTVAQLLLLFSRARPG